MMSSILVLIYINVSFGFCRILIYIANALNCNKNFYQRFCMNKILINCLTFVGIRIKISSKLKKKKKDYDTIQINFN